MGVKVGKGVSLEGAGWNGVSVGDALGSCVTSIKVGKDTGAGVRGMQEVKKSERNTKHKMRVVCGVIRNDRRRAAIINIRFGNTGG
jgi:hypothetical protein